MLGQLNRIDPGLVRDENAVNVFDKCVTGAGGELAKQSEIERLQSIFFYSSVFEFLVPYHQLKFYFIKYI